MSTDFPNVETEADFIRTYKYQLNLLMSDIRRYISVYDFDREKYESVYGDRLHEIYMCASNPPWSDLISHPVMEALACLWHMEVRELERDIIGNPVSDYDEALREYEKRSSLLDV